MTVARVKSVPSKRKTRILVVDDHPLFREGVVRMIDRQSHLICCGEADTVESAKEAVIECNPDMVIMDLRLGSGDGLELIKSVRAQVANLPILVLSQSDEGFYAERALRAGANGYLMKAEATEEVLTAIRTVLSGELYVSRRMSVLVLHKLLDRRTEQRQIGVENLTDRELQVFQSLGAGLSTRQIAQQLHLSVKTIETYRENIKHKLALLTGAELVRAATVWVQGSGEETNPSLRPPENPPRAKPRASKPTKSPAP